MTPKDLEPIRLAYDRIQQAAVKSGETIRDVLIYLTLGPKGIHIQGLKKHATNSHIVSWHQLSLSEVDPLQMGVEKVVESLQDTPSKVSKSNADS